MSSIKILFTLILFVLLFSCEEELDETVIQKVDEEQEEIEEEEEEINIQEIELKYSLYPEYTFWNSKFKITIERDSIIDSLNFSFKFNNLNLEPIDISVDSTALKFIFKTPLNSYSDSLEIICFSKVDTINKFTRKIDVVNSEIKLDPIQNHIHTDRPLMYLSKCHPLHLQKGKEHWLFQKGLQIVLYYNHHSD